MIRIFTFPAVLLILAASAAQGENWPRFRGAQGSGIASDTSIPLEWSESKNLQWKLDLPGSGSSSPIVWGDRVFVTTYSGYGDGSGGQISDLTRSLLAIDRSSGEVLWKADVPVSDASTEDPFQGFIEEHGYASNTPVTDGERIYCFFGKAGVVAFDREGNEVWKQSVGDLHSRKRWGSASSPILSGDLVIVKAGDEARSLFAFDKVSGEKRWQWEDASLEQTYGTPTIHRVNDSRSDLLVIGTGAIRGLDPNNGKQRWVTNTEILGNVSSSPVVSGNQMVIFGGFPRTMGAGIRLGLEGDVSDTARLWENVDVKAYMTAPIFHEGLLYFIRDEGIACCADPVKGELIYEKRLPGSSGQRGRGKPFYASPVLAQGHIIAVSRTAGTFIIEAKPEFNLVRVNTIAGDEGRFQGTPAISGDQLFLRSEAALYCISGSE